MFKFTKIEKVKGNRTITLLYGLSSLKEAFDEIREQVNAGSYMQHKKIDGKERLCAIFQGNHEKLVYNFLVKKKLIHDETSIVKKEIPKVEPKVRIKPRHEKMKPPEPSDTKCSWHDDFIYCRGHCVDFDIFEILGHDREVNISESKNISEMSDRQMNQLLFDMGFLTTTQVESLPLVPKTVEVLDREKVKFQSAYKICECNSKEITDKLRWTTYEFKPDDVNYRSVRFTSKQVNTVVYLVKEIERNLESRYGGGTRKSTKKSPKPEPPQFTYNIQKFPTKVPPPVESFWPKESLDIEEQVCLVNKKYMMYDQHEVKTKTKTRTRPRQKQQPSTHGDGLFAKMEYESVNKLQHETRSPKLKPETRPAKLKFQYETPPDPPTSSRATEKKENTRAEAKPDFWDEWEINRESVPRSKPRWGGTENNCVVVQKTSSLVKKDMEKINMEKINTEKKNLEKRNSVERSPVEENLMEENLTKKKSDPWDNWDDLETTKLPDKLVSEIKSEDVKSELKSRPGQKQILREIVCNAEDPEAIKRVKRDGKIVCSRPIILFLQEVGFENVTVADSNKWSVCVYDINGLESEWFVKYNPKEENKIYTREFPFEFPFEFPYES